jgi:hypothetical protein
MVLTVEHRTVSDVHRTVSSAPGRAPSKLLTLGFFHGTLCYNSPDCPVCTRHIRWANRAMVTWRSTVDCVYSKSAQCRSQMSGCKVRTHRTCPVCHRTVRCNYRTKDFNGQPLLTPTGRWHGTHRTVRCAIDSNSENSGWGYKYPQPLSFKPSKFSELHIHCKSKGKHCKDTIKAFNPLQAPKSTLLLRDLWEDHLCSFVAWIAFSFSFLFL